MLRNKTAAVLWAVMLLFVTLGFWRLEEQSAQARSDREASCEGTLSALNANQATALAGVRSTPPLEPDASPELLARRAETIKANGRLRASAAKSQRAEVRLRRSHTCEDVTYKDPVVP